MRYKLLLGAFLALGLSFTAVSTQAKWSDALQGSDGSYVVEKGTTHEGSLYATGEKVTVDGTVDGDLYCAAATVVITGTVKGDVLCAAQSIEILGTVDQDIRIAGQNVKVGSEVGGSLTAFGQNVMLQSGTVAGDLNGAAQALELDGTVQKDVVFGASQIIVRGSINGDANLASGTIDLRDKAAVKGDLYYSAIDQLDIRKDAVAGTVTYNSIESSDSDDSRDGLATGFIFGAAMLVSAIVAVLVAPRFFVRANEIATSNLLMVMLIGFGVVFGIPLIALGLMFTVLLIPLALSLLTAWLLVLGLSGLFFAYLIGSKVLSTSQNIVMRMSGGAAIVLLLYIIPLVNILAVLAALVIGSGMLVMTIMHNYQKPRYTLEAPKTTTKKTPPKKK